MVEIAVGRLGSPRGRVPVGGRELAAAPEVGQVLGRPLAANVAGPAVAPDVLPRGVVVHVLGAVPVRLPAACPHVVEIAR